MLCITSFKRNLIFELIDGHLWYFYNCKKSVSSIPEPTTSESIRLKNLIHVSYIALQKILVNNVSNLVESSEQLLHIINVTENNIISAIKRLKPIMTIGPNYIPAFLIKDGALVFSIPLTANL